MKTTAFILIFCAGTFSGVCQEQLKKLKMLEGTWEIDLTTFEAADPNAPSPPEMKVECTSVTSGNGMYCEVLMDDENGNEQVLSSELLAFNQSTGKIHLMLFNGLEVTYGTGTFDGNTFTYTDTTVDGKPMYDGQLSFTETTLTQVIRMPGETTDQMKITFNKM